MLIFNNNVVNICTFNTLIVLYISSNTILHNIIFIHMHIHILEVVKKDFISSHQQNPFQNCGPDPFLHFELGETPLLFQTVRQSRS